MKIKRIILPIILIAVAASCSAPQPTEISPSIPAAPPKSESQLPYVVAPTPAQTTPTPTTARIQPFYDGPHFYFSYPVDWEDITVISNKSLTPDPTAEAAFGIFNGNDPLKSDDSTVFYVLDYGPSGDILDVIAAMAKVRGEKVEYERIQGQQCSITKIDKNIQSSAVGIFILRAKGTLC